MKEQVLVSVRSLCKDFTRPNGTVFTALEGIHLDVYDGEFLAILGLSGSGKSTLLRCMAGLMKPDRGQVVYSASVDRRKNFSSFVFQNFALFPWLTVRENVEIALESLPKSERGERTDRVLSTVGLTGFEDSYPRELSGGMRQRVSIARATVSDPLVMFMDEPFSSLDPLTGESLRAELGRLWTQPGRTIRSIVLVTHSLDEALQLADRIVILSSSPGTVHKTIDVPLARPRNSNSPEFLQLEEYLEKSFGELHLDKLTAAHYDMQELGRPPVSRAPGESEASVTGVTDAQAAASQSEEITGAPAQTTPTVRLKPLINLSLPLVEGLLSFLAEEEKAGGSMDLYDVANEMRLRLDQMLPAVASAEMLGYIDTPGTTLVLTPAGHEYVHEQDSQRRHLLLRQAVKALPVVAHIYEIVRSQGTEGIERSMAIGQLALLLPFEDPEEQFDALLKWCRAVNLFTYDTQTELLVAVD